MNRPADTVSADEARDIEMKGMNERDFQAWVKGYAVDHGWLFFHNYDSRRSDKGFLDCMMIRHDVMVVAELKVHKKHSKVTPGQQEWLDAFKRIEDRIQAVFESEGYGPSIQRPVQTYLWRPLDWKTIEEVLS